MNDKIGKTDVSYEEHIRELEEMLDSMVDVMSTAIDALTPYNARHSKNMTIRGQAFLRWINENEGSLSGRWKHGHISDEELRRFTLAVQLHDVGKLVTPLHIMNKDTRLGGYEQRVFGRLRLIGALDKVAFLEGRMPEDIYNERAELLKKADNFIRRIDKAADLSEKDLDFIDRLSHMTYVNESGEEHPWLDPIEISKLSIRRGTLTRHERGIMEKHAALTAKLLSEMKFPKADAEIPKWAADHHELLDGSGYPAHKKGDEIDWHVRLLTILDVYDALVARDRPYKKPLPPYESLEIMKDMAQHGKLDETLLGLFIESGAWQEV